MKTTMNPDGKPGFGRLLQRVFSSPLAGCSATESTPPSTLETMRREGWKNSISFTKEDVEMLRNMPTPASLLSESDDNSKPTTVSPTPPPYKVPRNVTRPYWSEDDGAWICEVHDQKFTGATSYEALGLALSQFTEKEDVFLVFFDYEPPPPPPRQDGLDKYFR